MIFMITNCADPVEMLHFFLQFILFYVIGPCLTYKYIKNWSTQRIQIFFLAILVYMSNIIYI